MSRCAQSRSVNLAARRASQRRMRSRLAIRDVLARGRMPATCSFAACVLRHARARDVYSRKPCMYRPRAPPSRHSPPCAPSATHRARRTRRSAARTRSDSIRLDPALFGSIRLYSARIKSTRIEPAAHAAGSRRSSIPHHSPHASATAPRIAPPAAVNPHRNCGDTRPDSSPRCA